MRCAQRSTGVFSCAAGGGTAPSSILRVASEPAPATAGHVIHDQRFVTSGRLTGQGVAASLDRCFAKTTGKLPVHRNNFGTSILSGEFKRLMTRLAPYAAAASARSSILNDSSSSFSDDRARISIN
jgi:hypothetical protein